MPAARSFASERPSEIMHAPRRRTPAARSSRRSIRLPAGGAVRDSGGLPYAPMSRTPSGGTALHRDSRRPRAQSQERRCEPRAQSIHRDHRRFGQRQEHPGVRHPVRGGPTALPRVSQRLRPAVRAACIAAGCGRHLRHPAHRGDRAAHQPRRTQEHGGNAHRDLSLPAPAVREAGRAVLPCLRSSHRTPICGRDSRAPAQGVSRQEHHSAGAAHRGAQGFVYGPRQMGARQGLCSSASRRQPAAHGEMAAARPIHRAQYRTADCHAQRRRRPRGRAARRAGLGPAAWTRRGARPRFRAGCRGRVLHQARLPQLRHGFSRTRPPPVFLQLETWLVQDLFRHRAEPAAIRCRAKRRGIAVARIC